MRKTCDSSKTACTAWFSARADSRSVPNGFSMITRVSPVARPGVAEHADDRGERGRRDGKMK